jgi:hypothetical protein
VLISVIPPVGARPSARPRVGGRLARHDELPLLLNLVHYGRESRASNALPEALAPLLAASRPAPLSEQRDDVSLADMRGAASADESDAASMALSARDDRRTVATLSVLVLSITLDAAVCASLGPTDAGAVRLRDDVEGSILDALYRFRSGTSGTSGEIVLHTYERQVCVCVPLPSWDAVRVANSGSVWWCVAARVTAVSHRHRRGMCALF